MSKHTQLAIKDERAKKKKSQNKSNLTKEKNVGALTKKKGNLIKEKFTSFKIV